MGRDAATKHLSERELIAFRDGEHDDPRVREHLATCAKCQRHYDDCRWGLSLRPLPGSLAEGHPSKEELAAFWNNALSPEPARRVQRHVRGCSRCLAIYQRLRAGDPERVYGSPGVELMRRVQSRFSSRPAPVDLGTLWLRRAGDALGLSYQPAASSVRRTGSAVLEFNQASIAEQAMDHVAEERVARHPASARARRQRRMRETERPARLVQRLVEMSEAADLSDAVQVDAGNLRLSLQLVPEAGAAFLSLRIVWADTREPAADVPLVLRSDSGETAETRTGRDGAARLPLPSGGATLELQARTPIVLALRNLEGA